MRIKSNPYEAAGEAFAIDTLKDVLGRLEKKADLQLFQVDMLLGLLVNQVAPVILAANDPKLLFVYLPMRKILENMRDGMQHAQGSETIDYQYGFPAAQEAEEEPGAFDFSPY